MKSQLIAKYLLWIIFGLIVIALIFLLPAVVPGISGLKDYRTGVIIMFFAVLYLVLLGLAGGPHRPKADHK